MQNQQKEKKTLAAEFLHLTPLTVPPELCKMYLKRNIQGVSLKTYLKILQIIKIHPL
jgi:hypothetical protein